MEQLWFVNSLRRSLYAARLRALRIRPMPKTMTAAARVIAPKYTKTIAPPGALVIAMPDRKKPADTSTAASGSAMLVAQTRPAGSMTLSRRTWQTRDRMTITPASACLARQARNPQG